MALALRSASCASEYVLGARSGARAWGVPPPAWAGASLSAHRPPLIHFAGEGMNRPSSLLHCSLSVCTARASSRTLIPGSFLAFFLAFHSAQASSRASLRGYASQNCSNRMSGSSAG
jgi:hypothetical protein